MGTSRFRELDTALETVAGKLMLATEKEIGAAAEAWRVRALALDQYNAPDSPVLVATHITRFLKLYLESVKRHES